MNSDKIRTINEIRLIMENTIIENTTSYPVFFTYAQQFGKDSGSG